MSSLPGDYDLTVQVGTERIHEWYDGLYAASSGSWNDITADVMSINCTRGSIDLLQQPSVGTARIVLHNTDGEYDPDNTGASIYPYLRPGAVVRISADTSGGTLTPIWTGYIAPRNGFSFGRMDQLPTVTVNCFDPLGFVASDDITLDGANSLADTALGNSPGGHILSILTNELTWDVPASHDIDRGATPLRRSPDFSGSALAACHRIAQSDMGFFFMKADGLWSYRGRYASILDSSVSTSQATFSDDGADLEVLSDTLETGYGDRVYTKIKLSDADGDVTIFNVSVAGGNVAIEQADRVFYTGTNDADLGWATETFAVQTWVENENWAQSNADLLASRYGTLAQYPLTFSFSPLSSSGLRDEAVGRELMDRVTVEWTPYSGASQRSHECFVTQITHSIEPGGWVTSYRLVSAEREGFATPTQYLIINDATYGLIDTHKVAP